MILVQVHDFLSAMFGIPELQKLASTLKPKNIPGTLYHYTSGSGLIGILNTRAIRATSVRFLNDSTEYELALNLARENIQNRRKNATSQHEEILYTVLMQGLLGRFGAEVYVSSFTKNGDQLSQWRAYCPRTGGYAIGFALPANGGEKFFSSSLSLRRGIPRKARWGSFR